MNIIEEIINKLDKKNQERLNGSSLNHPLIGKPCLYKDSVKGNLHPALPYETYRPSDENEIRIAEYKQENPLLTIAYFDIKPFFEGDDVYVKNISAINPDDLIPADSSSKLAQKISCIILSWLMDNRSGTLNDIQKRRQLEEPETD